MKLPDKKSELIKLAVRDLEKCEQDPRYTINMMVFHQPWDGGCEVCFAGAVAAKTGCANPLTMWEEFEFELDSETIDKFSFLDTLRSYVDYNDLSVTRKMKNLDQVTYENNPTLFKQNMLKIAQFYREERK